MKLFLYRSFFIACCILAYTAASSQSKLLFREDWKEIPAATPVTQEHVANPNLILTLYGPTKDQIKKSNHPPIPNDPYYIWSGDCKGNWAFTLSYRDKWVDLTGNAKINLRTRQSGFHQLHLILKLDTGDWLVSDQSVAYTPDWIEKEFKIADLSWRKLNIETVTEGNPVKNPDLSKVAEIGFTDLMPGGGTPASSRVDWIEVYGKEVSKK
jgi:hypothetical protein